MGKYNRNGEKNNFRVLITGGGSGGHTGPAIAVSQALLKENANLFYIGSKSGIEKSKAAEENIPYYAIPTGKLRRYFSFQNFTDVLRILAGIIKAFFILLKIKPAVIFSTGGFVAVPVVISAWVLRIPVLIHEQTTNIGLANKISARFARKIAVTHKNSAKFFPAQKVIWTGIPLRQELFSGDRQKGLSDNGLNPDLPVIFVTGGSQGSHLINMCVKDALSEVLEFCQIIHQCGTGTQSIPSDEKELDNHRNTLPDNLKQRYLIKPFISSELPDILAMTDLIIGRSGAGTVNEAVALKNPAIFVPLKIAQQDEQTKNAKIMVDTGTAIIITEDDLNPEVLISTLKDLMLNGTIREMQNAFANLVPDKQNSNPADHIVSLLLEIAGK